MTTDPRTSSQGRTNLALATPELTTGLLVLPQRQTALVAKQAAQVHLLSRAG